ncbi:PREDICTED: pentatricopeptide repeat-containing protein At3g02490, mitochondrial [Fragaria vesca subsp. vesca]|uniref:pentatricopeptide repeat-containing protein At3g02490, mitochondrial n=1 Tax=Fragaria vesca subsp. vesca TaxID=101020 RepID=UPI0002C3692C|nr:PREDICTED: pentatricopeptide repeat-containing protein At3g02490, mitochondrial [Fragaria vesca subsp. vesca]
MRHPWQRLLRLRSHLRSSPHVRSQSSSHSQVISQSNLHSFSLFHTHTLHPKLPTLPPIFNYPLNPRNPISRRLSSEPEIESKDPGHGVIAEVFSKARDEIDVRKELELHNVEFTHDVVLSVLKSLESSPDVARRVFDWVLVNEGERLGSKSYNQMLCVLGVNGAVEEFWEMVSVMKKKGYGVSRWVYDRVLEKFVEDGLESDAEKLRNVFASGSVDGSVAKACQRVCKIVREEVWSDDVERQIRELDVVFSGDLVKMVVENLETEPTKALIFFRWVEEAGLFKHDQETYNAVARVLERKDCLDRFWKVVGEMRSKGYELESKTYVKGFARFMQKQKALIEDAVDFYEFAMAGTNKPSWYCCTFLLKKIVVGKELDMGLFSRVVRIYTESGKALTDSTLDAVLKSLISVGRLRECNKVFKVMEEGGFVASGNLKGKIAFTLGRAGKEDDANDFINILLEAGSDPGYKAWSSLIVGYCVAGHLEKASDCFQKMIKREGVASVASGCFDSIVNAYCKKSGATDVCRFLSDWVSRRQLKPWQTTYKLLISQLLSQGEFADALHILGLMKNDGFPPFIDPFIKHVSKHGTGDDAIAFLKTMASKKFPSTIVFLRVFEAYLKAGRRSEAQDFLSRCPGYIRNHADVLNLFCPNKFGEGAATNVVAA